MKKQQSERQQPKRQRPKRQRPKKQLSQQPNCRGCAPAHPVKKLEALNCDVQVETKARTGTPAKILGSELLMDAVSCIPLSAGLLSSILTATELDSSLPACLAVCTVSVAVVTLLSRRWWLFPAIFLALTAVWLPTGILTGRVADNIGYWREFIGWIISGAVYLPYAIDAGFTTLIYILAVFAVTLPMFLMLRRFFFFPVFVLLQTVAVILPAIFTSADLSAAVCLGAAGLVLLLPRVFAKHIEKLGDTVPGKTEHSEISRARMQAVAIPAAVFAVLIALWITPADTQSWRSYLLNVWIEDINTLFAGRYRDPSVISDHFNLAQSGYQTESGGLGGPVTLNDEVYLLVQAPRPVLLKGLVLDYYDGEKWYASRQDGDMRYNSLLWRREKNDRFDLDKPVGTTQARRLFKQLTDEISISITHDKATFNTLFMAGYVSDITPGSQFKGSAVYFNRRSDVFVHGRFPRMAQYTLRTRVWNTQLSDFAELFVQLEEQTRDVKRYAEVSERYTQLPEDLPDNVLNTASEITDGIDSPYMKASAISHWLAGNMEYTLKPETPPDDVDFTAFFLDSREGYCVYYATAMTVLARCVGLPARYVQGFALIDNAQWGSFYQYRATGLSAHAWSEVYFEGIGWLTFDPLSWDVDAPLNGVAGEDEQPVNTPRPTPSPTPTGDMPDSEQSSTQKDGNTRSGNAILTVLISGLLVLVLYGLYKLALYAGPKRNARLWSYDVVRRFYNEQSKQLDALYNDTLKLLALQGLTVQKDETLVTFPERVDRSIKLDGTTLTSFAGAMMNSHFGNMPPSDEEIMHACRYHSSLETLTLEVLGKRKYLFKRILTAPYVCKAASSASQSEKNPVQ